MHERHHHTSFSSLHCKVRTTPCLLFWYRFQISFAWAKEAVLLDFGKAANELRDCPYTGHNNTRQHFSELEGCRHYEYPISPIFTRWILKTWLSVLLFICRSRIWRMTSFCGPRQLIPVAVFFSMDSSRLRPCTLFSSRRLCSCRFSGAVVATSQTA